MNINIFCLLFKKKIYLCKHKAHIALTDKYNKEVDKFSKDANESLTYWINLVKLMDEDDYVNVGGKDICSYYCIKLKIDKKIVLYIIEKCGYCFKFAHEKFKDDEEVVLAAIKQSAWYLKYASKRLQNDREIVLTAMKNNWRALEFASKKLRNDREIVLIAVKNNWRAFEFASKELRNDKDIVSVANI